MKFYKFFHSFFFTFKKYYDECQNPFKFWWWLDRVSHVISLDGKAHIFIEPFLRELKKCKRRPPKEYDFFEFLLQLKKWNDTLWGKYWIKKIYWGIYRTRTRDGPELGWPLRNWQRKMEKKSYSFFDKFCQVQRVRTLVPPISGAALVDAPIWWKKIILIPMDPNRS